MGLSKKAKEQRRKALISAREKNPKYQNSHNDALWGSQLEISANSESDATPEDLSETHPESDATPEDLSQLDDQLADLTSDSNSSTEFSAPADRLLIIPFSFILSLLKMISCPMCKEQGRFGASVTHMNGFLNDINFLCRCKHSFSLMNFPDFDINAVLIRNLITNGITKQQFQRVLQVGNFGANVEGVDRSINLSTKSMMTVYKEQNDQIIQGADQIQKAAMDDLHRANKGITISTDMTYTKRGYHSPAGHAALICDGKVIDSRTAKRGKKTSKSYGDIVDMPANKLESYVIKNMIKDAILYLGPLIEQIDIDQDATLETVIKNMKWEEADTRRPNKWTGKIEVTAEMVGQSVWNGKIPQINSDKVCFDRNNKKKLGPNEVKVGSN